MQSKLKIIADASLHSKIDVIVEKVHLVLV